MDILREPREITAAPLGATVHSLGNFGVQHLKQTPNEETLFPKIRALHISSMFWKYAEHKVDE